MASIIQSYHFFKLKIEKYREHFSERHGILGISYYADNFRFSDDIWCSGRYSYGNVAICIIFGWL